MCTGTPVRCERTVRLRYHVNECKSLTAGGIGIRHGLATRSLSSHVNLSRLSLKPLGQLSQLDTSKTCFSKKLKLS